MVCTHTLVYLTTDTQICLGYKKRGFGAGYFNGFGGKVEAGETPKEAAVRELTEECGVTTTVAALQPVAQLALQYDENHTVHMQVYFATVWQGNTVETEEMRPAWFSRRELPLAQMWESDAAWLPRVLAGEQLAGEATFAADGKSVLTQQYHPWRR